MSENYLQHADHFMRILNEQENLRKTKFSENKTNNTNLETEVKDNNPEETIADEKNIVTEIKTSIK